MDTTKARHAKVTAGGHQELLVIDESTGRNVAITYDKDDAALIAAAPDLLAALESITNDVDRAGGSIRTITAKSIIAARAAIAKATGAD